MPEYTPVKGACGKEQGAIAGDGHGGVLAGVIAPGGPQSSHLNVETMGARMKVWPPSVDRYTPSSYAAPSTTLPVPLVARCTQCGWRPRTAAAGAAASRRRHTKVAAAAEVERRPLVIIVRARRGLCGIVGTEIISG